MLYSGLFSNPDRHFGVRIAEWLSHSAVVQEVPGSHPGDAESVGQ